MKLLFYTDVHLKGKSPRHRKDCYADAILTKLREIYNTAEKENVSVVLFGGDFFDYWKIYEYSVISEAIDIIGESKIPTWSVLGEHDTYGHSPDSFTDSALNFLMRRCPRFKMLTSPVHLDGVSLYPKHEHQTLKEVESREEPPSGNKTILVCHELLTVKRLPFECFLTSDQKLPYDLVVSGDLHSGFATHKVGNTVFANPGTIARKACNEANRRPKILLIDTEPDIVVQDIYLKNVLDGSKAFDVTNVKEEEVEVETPTISANDFVEAINKLGKSSEDIFELINTMGQSTGIDTGVLNYIAGKRVADA